MFAVDVIIPVFNAEKFIQATLESVLNQSLKANRIIVIDDGSTDKTASIVKQLATAHPQIEHHYQTNAGLSSARNWGIKLSTSPYLAFLDADDLWLPEKLEKQMSVFRTHNIELSKPLGLVFCFYSLINEQGEHLPSNRLEEMRVSPLEGLVFEDLLTGNKVLSSGSGVLLKKEAFQIAGCFDTELQSSEDWDMWLRISQHFSFMCVKDCLVYIRLHSSNMQKKRRQLLRSIFVVWKKCLTLYRANPQKLQCSIEHTLQFSNHFLSTIFYGLVDSRQELKAIFNNSYGQLLFSILKILFRRLKYVTLKT